ncbi:hypothetical protein CAEBREN_32050 [Caenorhabditis brenneri]|uniref:Uncharacterized protein n=1 Tax=Caenorhabditis brenneri TaxID=135651 RepID=G0NVH4_CAEBE|nr:hypothetical protein CAEBREN_32050 [Caenorhabditis brenneri]
MSYNRESSSLRYRSGSVERRSITNSTPGGRDPAPYRTSYGTERGRSRDLPSINTRMSRATSYDPFASSNRASSVIRGSGGSGLSNSDYTPRISSYTSRFVSQKSIFFDFRISRYGSTEQLNSTSSYRPSSYRSGSIASSGGSGGGGGSTSSITSSHTPRNVRAGSVSIGAYDPPSRSSNHSDSVSSTSTFSRYRPDNSTSYTPSLSRYRSTDLSSTSDYSTSKYRSPDNSYSSSRCSSTVSNRYSSHNKPSSAYSSRTSTSSSFRSDRDYRSMSRTTDNEEEDEIESTFRKLYRKYVTDSEPDLTKNKEEGSLAEKVSRRFESSKSETEDDDNSISEEDEDEILSKYQAKGLRRTAWKEHNICRPAPQALSHLERLSVTPRELKTLEKPISRSVSPEMKPLTRSFQMEATFGIAAPKKESEDVKKFESVSEPKVELFKKSLEDIPKLEPVRDVTVKKDSEDITKNSIQPKSITPTKSIQIPDDVPKLVDMSSDESEKSEEEEESAEEADDPKIVPNEVKSTVPPAPEPEPIKKVVSTIKINGIPVKETAAEPVKVEREAQKEGLNGPVRIRIRDRSPSRIREKIPVLILPKVSFFQNPPAKETTPKLSENLISSAVNVVLNHPEEKSKEEKKQEESRELSEEKSSESDTTTTSSRASSLRKRRDPNRTLENLQSILKAGKMNNTGEEKKQDEQKEETTEQNKEENGNEEKKIRRIPIPLVLITEPSNPSTPAATTPVTTAASICLWNNNEAKRTSSSTEDDEEYDEEEDYSSGDWTEGEDDEEYITDEEEDNEFSVSQTFSLKDHINLRELYPLATSASNTSALVSEFSDGDTFLADARKEESRGRVDSLFAVPAPTFTCSVTYDGMMPGDDDEEWSDEVHSCEEGDDDDFRVLPIARPGSSSLGAYMSPGSMTSDDESGSNYDGRTVGCTLKLVDRAARKDSDETDESEYYDDEEEMEDEEYEDEEYWDEEIEYEDEEEYEYEDEEVLEEYVDEEEEEDVEEDVTMKSVEEEESSEEEEEMSIMLESEEPHELFVTPPIKLMTESLVEEMIEEACYGEIPEETLFALDEIEVEDYTGQKDVHLIPTFVRQMTEDIREESTSRFASDRKPATDFAKKAVIQPTKLEKVQVGTKIDTKVAPSEEEKKKMKEEEERKKREEEEEKKRKEKELEMKRKKKEEEEKEKKEKEAKMAAALAAGKEDKSALRKSALNMKDEDAKKKVATDEKTAAQKARRFGTVSAMAGKFDESEEIEKKEEKVLYKKSSRLESRDAEKPKRVYEVIKPVINDDFDKQMEEIRMQMKSGSNQLQNKMKDLSKGILTVKEEAKSREMEEKRRVTTEKATGAFGKAEEEKARWKASRDAEAAREYAKIEAEKHLKKKRILIDKPSGETVLNQEKAEAPKRTIRRWKPPPPDPNAVIPSFSCGPKEAPKPKIAPAATESTGKTSKPSTPTARRKSLASPVPAPKESGTVPAPAIQNIPKSEGAAATRIRNQAAVAATTASPTTVIPSSTPSAPSSVTDSPKPTSRRYNARRKTQEIVNESLVKAKVSLPTTKRRKRNPRKTRFTRSDRDADLLLGYEKGSTFEQVGEFTGERICIFFQLERLFDQATRNRRPLATKFEKIRRLAPSKIFISELTDIDKIYKSSEIRDIIASVNMVY